MTRENDSYHPEDPLGLWTEPWPPLSEDDSADLGAEETLGPIMEEGLAQGDSTLEPVREYNLRERLVISGIGSVALTGLSFVGIKASELLFNTDIPNNKEEAILFIAGISGAATGFAGSGTLKGSESS